MSIWGFQKSKDVHSTANLEPGVLLTLNLRPEKLMMDDLGVGFTIQGLDRVLRTGGSIVEYVPEK